MTYADPLEKFFGESSARRLLLLSDLIKRRVTRCHDMTSHDVLLSCDCSVFVQIFDRADDDSEKEKKTKNNRVEAFDVGKTSRVKSISKTRIDRKTLSFD